MTDLYSKRSSGKSCDDKIVLLDVESPTARVRNRLLIPQVVEDGPKVSEIVLNEERSSLFFKNTESFRCLAQILLSRSSVFKHPLYMFPPLEDPGLEEAILYEPVPLEEDCIGATLYLDKCKTYGIAPFSAIVKQLETEELNLRFYGLSLNQLKALHWALRINEYVTTLILEENYMVEEAIKCFSYVLEENITLKHLNLQKCNIRSKGAAILAPGLANNQTLKYLDLSFNDLNDDGIEALQEALKGNNSIRILKLGHNSFTEACGPALEKILEGNRSIQELDLSWNFLYTGPGLKNLFNGLGNNKVLKMVDLSWNGIGEDSVIMLLGKMLRTAGLTVLDLSCNRIDGKGLNVIKKAFGVNEKLEELKIGKNPFGAEDAFGFLALVQKKPHFKILNLDGIFFLKPALAVLQKLEILGKTVIYEGIIGNYELSDPDVNKLLFERARFLLMTKPKKEKMKKDFGHFVLSLDPAPVPQEEAHKLLKKMKMKLDNDLKQAIFDRFSFKDGSINSGLMKEVYMSMYPDTVLPPPKPKKEKEKKGKKGPPSDRDYLEGIEIGGGLTEHEEDEYWLEEDLDRYYRKIMEEELQAEHGLYEMNDWHFD